MWRAWTRAGALSVPVLLLGLWSQTWLERSLLERTQADAHVQAARTATSLHRVEHQLIAETERLCRFDRRADRLRAELRAAPPRADARRTLSAMLETLELSEIEVEAADGSGAVRVVARAPGQKDAAPGDASVSLRASCPLDEGVDLITRRTHPLVAGGPHAPPWAVAREQPEGAGWIPVWPEDGPRGSERVWLKVAPPERPVAAVQAGTALCLVLTFGLGLWLMRHAEMTLPDAESTALTAIERAAARVAQGDLVSHIGITTGTPADRTLTAFNRMTEELRVTREKLMKAERAAAWQDIARRIAHEIKNPLSPIRTAMETLRKAHARSHADFDEIFEESSKAILEEVERLQRIVREFSDFARLPKPTPGAIDLHDTAQHAISVARHDGAPIALDGPNDLPAVRADREQLTQVLLNLLQNASAAARELRGDQARVELRLRREAGGVALEIHDNGPGVPEELRTQIFQPYFTQRAGGSGLGLSIAARIVEEHGSVLRVEDSPLGGALFVFSLGAEDAGTTRKG